MGYIRIITGGSFPNRDVSFSAMDHGHADAVAKAMEWLASTAAPSATALDHRLHDDGARPRKGFDRDGAGS